MTLRDLKEAGIEIAGYRKVQYWEEDDRYPAFPTVYYEGTDFSDMDEKYLDRNITCIFPYNTGSFSGITIEIEKE